MKRGRTSIGALRVGPAQEMRMSDRRLDATAAEAALPKEALCCPRPAIVRIRGSVLGLAG
jgi:hypothetical protein